MRNIHDNGGLFGLGTSARARKPVMKKGQRAVRGAAMLAAAGAFSLVSSVHAQTTRPVYMDQNGASGGLGSGTVTWDSVTADWSSSTGGTDPGLWAAGDVANFNSNFTVNLLDQETVGGLNFATKASTITTTVGTTGEGLVIGSNKVGGAGPIFSINQTFGGRQVIAVPIIGSGDMIINSNQSNTSFTVDLAGDMSQFTGNIYMNNVGSLPTTAGIGSQLQIDSPMSSSSTIYLDNGVGLTSNNQLGIDTNTKDVTYGTLTTPYPGTVGDNSSGTLLQTTPNVFTLSSNIVLNYNNVANAAPNTIGAPNGPTLLIDGVLTKFAKIITYAGVISGNGSLDIGGSNGTSILSGQNTYTGNTYVAVSDGNGLVQLAADNTIPATSTLVFGQVAPNGLSGSVGPVDLDGHNQTIAGLATAVNSASPAAIAAGNIYNLVVNNPSFAGGAGFFQNVSGNAASITIAPPTNAATIYKGDIGDTNATNTVPPFTNNEPYNNGITNGQQYTTALTNISLTLNGAKDGGKEVLALAPSDNLPNGNELSGPITVNNNATLVLGRGYDLTNATYSGGPGLGVPGTNYTVTGSGGIVVNSGGTLASLASDVTHFIGGSQGDITLMSGSNLSVGEAAMSSAANANGGTLTLSADNVGTLATNNVIFDGGASMTFSIKSGTSFDYLFLNGGLELDSSDPTHTINIDLSTGGTIVPGTYNLVNAEGGIAGDTSSYVLGATPTGTNDTFELNDNGQSLQLVVLAPLLEWDPSGSGAGQGYVNEQGGEWTDGNGADGAPATTFFSQLTHQETTWSNTSTDEVLIGDDATQNGGQITLGNNIVAAGGIEFGPIAPGANYSIINNNGNNYTLTIGSGGLSVENSAATSTTPSAEIDVPIILSSSQTWNIAAGQFLNITGSITENDNPSSYTLTVTGGGNAEFSGDNGNIGTLGVTDGSIVVLGSTTAIGNATINLDGGGVEFSVNGSPTNPITIGTHGGALGATTGFSVVYAPNINSTGGIEAIGTGAITFQGSISAVGIQANTSGAGGIATFNGPVTDSADLLVTGGTVSFQSSLSVAGTSTFSGGSTYLNNTAAANTFTGGITIAGGTVYAQSSNALGNATITFPGALAGGLDIAGAATLSNPLNGTGSGATGPTGNSYGDTVYIDTTMAFTLTGSTEGTGDLRWYADPNHTGGVNPTIALDEASQRPGGGAEYFNIPGVTIVIPNDPAANTGTALGLSTQSFMQSATLDVEIPFATSGDLRGESGTTNGSGTLALTKTGPGLLAVNNAAGSSTRGTITVNEGELEGTSNSGLGGQSNTMLTYIITGPTSVLGLDYANSRTGGVYTLSNGGKISRDNVYYAETITNNVGTIAATNWAGESDIIAASASDVVSVASGTGIIEDGAMEGSSSVNLTSTPSLFTVQNPVVVNGGATLNLQNDNPQYNPSTQTGGAEASYILALRGPGGTGTAYDTLTIQPGATVANTGTGEVRFGRTNSGGIPIVAGDGATATDAVMLLGSVASGNDDVYMTDSNANTGQFNTIFVVNGVGNTGLRIEAPMNATYLDPNDPNSNPQMTEGTTGLFGINTTATAPNGGVVTAPYFSGVGNAFTVASPNRLQALNNSFSYVTAGGTTTITPAGTLTLAANDAGDVTGTINDGPLSAPGAVVNSVTQGAIALALDNTSGSGGKHTYVIDPAIDGNGGSFANFAGLTIERTYSTGAAVIAQLQINSGMTKIPALNITGGASLDITNQGLAVDPATGPAPTAQILQYLKTSYDKGAWDLGGGIGSSQVSAVPGTSIGYAENDLLPTPYTDFGGQTVDNNAVLVRFTWLGDLNLDGVVDSTDLGMMSASGSTWATGDLNYDGKVNQDDWSLFFLGDAEQTGQLPLAVPEPAAASLLIAGAGLLMRRRRRA